LEDGFPFGSGFDLVARLNGVLEIAVPSDPEESVFDGIRWLIEIDELNPKTNRIPKKAETRILLISFPP
tara:strand:- start:380 stop:586 length:207 start_codon:yes stop_codon:yes gene_type:complete